MNTLYYGDNREILPRHVKDESVDLIYLDPPFKSNQDYNVLFAEQSGEKSAAQIMAFEDTWHWNEESAKWFEHVVSQGGKAGDLLVAFHRFLGENDMMAYLANMAPCLVELRRVLKPTGSIYLHCDPTASHYLKLLMDAVFGAVNYRNEITWKRQSAHSDAKNKFPDVTDAILFYARSPKFKFKPSYTAHDPEYIRKFYKHDDDDGRGVYRLDNMASPNPRPNMMYVWRGFSFPAKGWRYQVDTMKKLDDEGRIWYPRTSRGRLDTSKRPALKRYLLEQEGSIVTNVWTDIQPLHSAAAERLGYPTQKPEALLERIIKASSNKGDVVLDPFCGCGTAVAVAQKLNRKWIGIDITHLAITLIKKRLLDAHGIVATGEKAPIPNRIEGRSIDSPIVATGEKAPIPNPSPVNGGREPEAYRVIGEPVDLDGAIALAEQDKYQFQWWALGLVGARPEEQKKGADRGIDGRRTFFEGKDRHPEQILISVKGGKSGSPHVRDLVGTMKREKAALGLLITLNEPTREMIKEAASAGFYHSEFGGTKHAKVQILTIERLLEGHKPDLPPIATAGWSDPTFKKAPKVKKGHKGNTELELE